MTPLVEIITRLKQQHAAGWSPVSHLYECVGLCMCQVALLYPSQCFSSNSKWDSSLVSNVFN